MRGHAALYVLWLILFVAGCSGPASDRSFELVYSISQDNVSPGSTYTAAIDISDVPGGSVLRGVEVLATDGIEITDVRLAALTEGRGGHVAGLFIDIDEALDYVPVEQWPIAGTEWTDEIANNRPAVYVELHYTGPGPAAVLKLTTLFSDIEGGSTSHVSRNHAICLLDEAEETLEDVGTTCQRAAERGLRIWESHPNR